MLWDDLFSFTHFKHPLFSKNFPFWHPLNLLEEYFQNFSYSLDIPIQASIFLQGKISIGKGTTIDPGVSIQGPCIIGENCHIAHGAFLRGSVILGDGCSIGHGSELKNVILLDEACVAHLCYVGDSILGSHVNLGAGVKCSNLRLDRSEIHVAIDGQKINTGRKKLGAILGSGVQIGCNSVLNPGTIVGKNSAIYPLLNVGGTIPSYSEVKGEKNWKIESKAEKILQRLIHEP